jgi:hypothetical protein
MNSVRSRRRGRAAEQLAESYIEGRVSPRVVPFADLRDLGAWLQRTRRDQCAIGAPPHAAHAREGLTLEPCPGTCVIVRTHRRFISS